MLFFVFWVVGVFGVGGLVGGGVPPASVWGWADGLGGVDCV
uniref:OMP1598 n=1 Tax=Helicobacter salomonis TaxID=56878 RepID=A0A1M4NI92_9HELI|nr:OMP1598 [Helicobacter salomonis]